MAVIKSILKKTHQEAVVKVSGSADSATISLSNDIVASGQELTGLLSSPPAIAVNITGLVWTGDTNGIITITRNSVVVATLQANAAGSLEFNGQSMIPDSTENWADLVVTISGAQAECWIKLRKVSGYRTTIEPEQFGSHDDPTVAGS